VLARALFGAGANDAEQLSGPACRPPGTGPVRLRPVSAVDGLNHISFCRNKKEDGVLFSSTAHTDRPQGRPLMIRPVC
jgi:hypothetical protein